MSALPGEDLIRKGVRDLAAGKETIHALLVSIGFPRLRRSGYPLRVRPIREPEHRLYLKLASKNSDSAHSRYNALLRRLVRFERALECVR